MKFRQLLLVLPFALGFAASAQAQEALAKSKGCLVCHTVDKKVVGPAYKEIATKYAGQADAAAKLEKKIISGGSGSFGAVAMPPNPQVKPEEAKALVKWILSLK